jgi:5-methylcytosine-specific restriction protein A
MPKKPSRWCAKCRAIHQGDCPQKKPWVKRSIKESGRGGRPWRRLRDRVIARDNGLCQPCLKVGLVTPFSEVDHIIPKAQGGDDSESNLQCICSDCHKAKTHKESLAGRGGKFSTDR